MRSMGLRMANEFEVWSGTLQVDRNPKRPHFSCASMIFFFLSSDGVAYLGAARLRFSLRATDDAYRESLDYPCGIFALCACLRVRRSFPEAELALSLEHTRGVQCGEAGALSETLRATPCFR